MTHLCTSCGHQFEHADLSGCRQPNGVMTYRCQACDDRSAPRCDYTTTTHRRCTRDAGHHGQHFLG